MNNYNFTFLCEDSRIERFELIFRKGIVGTICPVHDDL